jgi:hypothetical protein
MRRQAARLALILSAVCTTSLSATAQQSAPSQTPQPAPTAIPSPPPTPAQTQTAVTNDQPTTTTPPPPAANPADVATQDAIIAALYDVISGPAGRKRDWDRFRSLFAPGARLIPTAPRRPTGTPPDAPLTGKEEYVPRALTPEEYIQRSGPFLEGQGFFERETARRTEQYGHIAHAFSTYEGKLKSADAKPFVRGINSIQLVNDGRRWWIVTVFWEAETERTPLPEKYLKSVP